MSVFGVVLLFLYGIVLGSFYNVVVYRLPRKLSLVHPRSHCPKCKRQLSPGELVPLFSFLFQRGKCRGCGAPISYRYPLVELITGLGFAASGFLAPNIPTLIVGLFLFSLLLVIALIDLEHKIIPNVLSLSGTVSALFFALMGWTIPIEQSLFGIIIGGGVMLSIAVLSRGGMGMGDVKLLAMIGALVGPWNSLLVLFWASVTGSIAGIIFLYVTKQGRKTPIPFGPALALAGLLVYWWAVAF